MPPPRAQTTAMCEARSAADASLGGANIKNNAFTASSAQSRSRSKHRSRRPPHALIMRRYPRMARSATGTHSCRNLARGPTVAAGGPQVDLPPCRGAGEVEVFGGFVVLELNAGREEPRDQGALLGFGRLRREGTWVLGLRQCRLAGCTAEVPRMGLSAGIMAVWVGVG